MQVNHRTGFVAASAGFAACACLAWAPAAHAAADDPGTSESLVRLFHDSGRVSVRSFVQEFSVPLRLTTVDVHWNNERVTIPGISAPAGSQEAVDAITTASRPIAGNPYQDYVKVRNEVSGDVALPHGTASYYVSKESDYLAQQLGASWNRDFADRQWNVSLGASYGWDDIEPLRNAAVQAAADRKQTVHANLVATEVLSPSSVIRYGLEYNVVDGLQHNPYRNVFAGGSHVPERHPDHRERRDAFVRWHQWFENRSSLKTSWRVYSDDWGIASSELGTTLSQYVGRDAAVAWEYRWYTQSAASFARDEYASLDGVNGYRTGDYRMDALSSHLFGASLRLDLRAWNGASALLDRSTLWLDWQRYFNSNNYSADIVEAGVDFRFR
ncbi:MAG: DUF3570 domain-containing protein [Candidatus Eisenbacteria bacterium]